MAETLPPMSIDQLTDALNNPHFSSYVYIGNASELGWKMALGAQENIPGIRVYRVSGAMVKPFRKAFSVPSPSHIGVVFGFDEAVKAKLTKTKAEDFLALFNAIKAARS